MTAFSQYSHQTTLVGTDSWNDASQGSEVACSWDGNTLAVLGRDQTGSANVWVFTRTAGLWSQQGSKLVGTDMDDNGTQRYSVAISADGNTIAAGVAGDDDYTGAAWIFTRDNGIWTQQGPKLVGTGAVAGTFSAKQGYAVALSGDGNTLLVGGPADGPDLSHEMGAAWVFVRTGGVWTQQGSKLVGTGAVGNLVSQGCAVALSSDGNTALIGGENDNGAIGAAWVFTRSGSTWSQQAKLVGTVTAGSYDPYQGSEVALSADGNTAVITGPFDGSPQTGSSNGAAWVFTRTGGVWSQQGGKLNSTNSEDGGARIGSSVAISADGATVMLGAPLAFLRGPTAFVFTRTGGTWSLLQRLNTGSGYLGGGLGVALSYNGTTAFLGNDPPSIFADHTGSTLVFTRPGPVIPGAPANVVATAAMATSVSIAWPAVSAATAYQVYRSGNGVHYALVGTPNTNSFTDTTAAADTAYFYKVTASNADGTSAYSNIDLATTTIFTDPTLVPDTTRAKAAHFTELRTAVNALLAMSGHDDATYTNPALTPNLTPVRAVDLQELRVALNAARAHAGLGALSFTDPVVTASGTRIKAAHLDELRAGVR